MDAIWDWGIWVIGGVQSVSRPWLDLVMEIITLAGDELFYLVFLPFLFWCVDERKAFRLGMILFFSTFLNSWIKGLLHVKRPYIRKPGLIIGKEPPGTSTPSAHAQLSTTLWGGMAVIWKKRILVVLAIALPLLIGFSRVYLGVHYPTDVFLGWAIGGALVALWAILGSRIEAIVPKLNIRVRIAIIAGIAWLMCLLHRADVSAAAGFFGVGLGYAFNAERLKVSAEGAWWKKLLRFLLGAAVLAALYFGLKKVLPGKGSSGEALYRFLRYGSLGVWVSLGAPWLFLKLKLAERRTAPAAFTPRSGSRDSPG